MPRYHFPIVDGTRLEDPVGIDLKDDTEAGKHADAIARHVSDIGHKKPRNVIAIDDDGAEVHKSPVKRHD
jgi:hypothetical protein